MTAWSQERVWEAVEAWRWSPPTAAKVKTDEFELAVTPGSYSLTYVWGFRVAGARADERLKEVRARIEALGGTGARFQVTPLSRPPDLAERLVLAGYRPLEEAEILIWRFRDERDTPRLPPFRPAPGVEVREASTLEEYEAFMVLATPIFQDPVPSEESRAGFLREFHRQIREAGHSERFVAWEGGRPVGRGGMEVVGPVARFWGTGVLPECRKRGIYGALVGARCASAAQRGAEIALVTARVGTSGPILKHHGFEPMGTVRVFEGRWESGTAAESAHRRRP